MNLRYMICKNQITYVEIFVYKYDGLKSLERVYTNIY